MAESDTGARPDLRRRLLEHVRIPLHRDAYALTINVGFTAITGFVYWIVAARQYAPHAVGENSALISSMMFLAGIAGLNLPNLVVRFLPEAGSRTTRAVAGAYTAAALVAAVSVLVFVAGTGVWAPRLGFLHVEGRMLVWFLISTLMWCVFTIQDSVLAALGRAVWVPIENAVFSVLKLVLLAALAALAPVFGIFVSWTAAMLASVVGVNLLIFRRLVRRQHSRPAAVKFRDRDFARYFAADYACSIAWVSAVNLMPVIVTAVAGATTNAYYALAWAVAFPLYTVSSNVGISLVLHGTKDRAELAELTRRAAMHGARLLVPATLVVLVMAPQLLRLFGTSYAEHSATLLRLLAAGALPNLVIILAVSVSRVERRMGLAVLGLGAQAALSLALVTPLLRTMGVTGAGVAWLTSQCVAAAVVAVLWARRRPVQTSDAGRALKIGILASDGGAQQFEGQSPERVGSDTDAVGPDFDAVAGMTVTAAHPVLTDLARSWERQGIRWMLLRVPSNPAAPTGDVDVLVDPADWSALRRTALDRGFVALPGWDSPRNLMLVRYDRASDTWLLLEVVTSLSFRRAPAWESPELAPRALAARRSAGAALVAPAPGDAFWLLLLHCLLDKGRVDERYRGRLSALASSAAGSSFGEDVLSAAGVRTPSAELVAHVEAGRWDRLAEFGNGLAGDLRRCAGAGRRLTWAVRRGLAVAGRPMLLPKRRGVNVALLGPDGVGKSTLAAGLAASFPLGTGVVYMGVWKYAGGGPVRQVAEILSRPLRLWLGYLSAQRHQLLGRLVVFDRYTYEAALPSQPPLRALKAAYSWLLRHAVPSAQRVMIVDVGGHIAYGRKQENTPEELERERRFYVGLAATLPGAAVVDGTREPRAVRADVMELVWRDLARRWSGRSPAREHAS